MASTPVRAVSAEDAFELYLTVAGRSYKELAALTSTPENTIRSWATRGRWAERARKADEERARSAHTHTGALLQAEAPQRIGRLVELSEQDEDRRVALEATKHLLALSGYVPVTKTFTLHHRAPDPIPRDELAALDDDALDAALRDGVTSG